MKCVKRTVGKTTRVLRVSNGRAQTMIASGDWRPSSKGAWRHHGRKRIGAA